MYVNFSREIKFYRIDRIFKIQNPNLSGGVGDAAAAVRSESSNPIEDAFAKRLQMAAAAAVSASAQAHGTSGNQGVFKSGKLTGQHYRVIIIKITETFFTYSLFHIFVKSIFIHPKSESNDIERGI